MITGTNQEKAFYKAYRLCVGMADTNHVQYYFDNKGAILYAALV